MLVIVEILVAQRQAIDALREQLRDRVIDKPSVPLVRKTARQRARQAQTGVDLLQQQRAAIAGQRAPGKIGHHFPATEVLKLERSLLTLCRRPGVDACSS